jgi:predicted porin
MGSSATEVAGNNDTARISYYTPSFNGLTVGVSYAPGNTNVANSGLVDRNAGLSDIFDIGMNYSQTFGNVDVELSARWGTGDAGTVFAAVNPGFDNVLGTADDIATPAVTQAGDPETWAIGAQFSTAGFTFGGSYAENDSGLLFGAGDTEGWSLGMTYDMAGPWTIGFDTYQGEMNLGNVGFVTGKSEYTAYQIGAERELGNGVAWRIYAIQSETSASTNVPGILGNGISKYKLESTTIGTGIRLTF